MIEKANVHDVNILEKTIDPLIHKPKYIVGDKGYISNKLKQKYKAKNINIVYPYKQNSKTINTPVEKILLKRRYKVENFFANLKQN